MKDFAPRIPAAKAVEPAPGKGTTLVDNRASTVAQRKMQAAIAASPRQVAPHQPAPVQPAAPRPNRTGLPDKLKAGVESLSGHSLDDVQVHYNSAKPAQLQAHAYAQGTDIHLGPGQEKHLPHEAWHVVQQKQGRVRATMQLKNNVGVNNNNSLEKEADVMGREIQLVSIGPHISKMGGLSHRKYRGAVIQKNGWTKAKVKRYRKYLIERGTKRGLKNKPVHKLVRKYVKARKLADPSFKGLKLAPASTAGHHMPALALANKRSGSMPYGKRGSISEKLRRRVYFEGSDKQKSNAHGIAHENETFVGLGSRNAASFKGSDARLSWLQTLAHVGATYDDGVTPIEVGLGSQSDREAGKAHVLKSMSLAAAAKAIFKEDHKIAPSTKKVKPETTDSEPESDEEMWSFSSDED